MTKSRHKSPVAGTAADTAADADTGTGTGTAADTDTDTGTAADAGTATAAALGPLAEQLLHPLFDPPSILVPKPFVHVANLPIAANEI